MYLDLLVELLTMGAGLTRWPAFGTFSTYWVALSILNRRGGAWSCSNFKCHGCLIFIEAGPFLKKNKGGVDSGVRGKEQANWEEGALKSGCKINKR